MSEPTNTKTQMDSLLYLRAPSQLVAAVERAAASETSTVASYVRRALIKTLRADGQELAL